MSATMMGRPLQELLRDLAAAIDKDRGWPTLTTDVMRAAADELDLAAAPRAGADQEQT